MNQFLPKMKKLKLWAYCLIGGMFMFTASVSLSSCEAEINFGNNNDDWADNQLCEYIWITEWEEDFHQICRTELYFAYDGTGEEVYKVFDRYGLLIEERHSLMEWEWRNSSYSSLRMRFRDGDSYLEDIYWRGNKMFCYWNDIKTIFYKH